jgi:LysR family hydrogen peroxide-inducible transcriptional activator
MITLQQLEYILAVDTHRHFVTAADKCFVTQPTLSMQIRKLEDELGVVIFDRGKHPIVPTEVGEKIIEQARITVATSKKIHEIIANFNGTISGELNVGIIPSLAPYLLPLFIGNFLKKHPAVKINMVELLSEEIIVQLKNDLLDVGLLVTPLGESGIVEKPLFYEKMMLYVNPHHPYGDATSIIASEIATPDIWLLSKGHCFRSQVINLCSYQTSQSADASFEYQSGSLETLKRFVEKEGGFTMLPELAIDAAAASNANIVPIINPEPVREVSLVFSRNFAKERLIELLAKEIQASVPIEMLDSNRGKIVEWR